MNGFSRRQVLAGMGVGATSIVSSGTLSEKEPEEIVVNIYVASDVHEEYSNSNITGALENMRSVTKDVLMNLTAHADREYTVTVKLKEETIPVDDFSFENGDTFVEDWGSYIEESETITQTATTNLLLTSELIMTGSTEVNGYAEYPPELGQTNSGVPSAVFDFNAKALNKYTPTDDITEETILIDNDEHYVLNTVIHEIGHTLGFKHNMGTLTNLGDKIIVSPMIGSYVDLNELVFGENYWGESFQEISVIERFRADDIVRLRFNPRLAQYL